MNKRVSKFIGLKKEWRERKRKKILRRIAPSLDPLADSQYGVGLDGVDM